MTWHFPDAKPRSRRLKTLDVHADVFVGLLQGLARTDRLTVCQNPPPADAKVVGICVDETWNIVRLVIESAEFPEVEPNALPDYLLPMFGTYALPTDQLGGIERMQAILDDALRAKEGDPT